MNYCYVDYMKKRSHEHKLFQEVQEVLESNHSTLESIQFKTLGNLFPRNPQEVARILKALRGCQKLHTLDLSVPEEEIVEPIGGPWLQLMMNQDRESSGVAKSLVHFRLESFDLTQVRQSVEETLVPVLAQGQKHSLRHVSLAGCRITDKGLWKLVHGSQHFKHITTLQLPRMQTLSHISLLTMASLLQENHHLTVLDLTGNPTMFAMEEEDDEFHETSSEKKREPSREQALTAFMKALAKNTTLQELNLSHCGLHDEEFKFLLAALQENRKLTTLNVDFNNITRKHGLEQHLPHQLPKLRALSVLSMQGLKKKRKQKIRAIRRSDSASTSSSREEEYHHDSPHFQEDDEMITTRYYFEEESSQAAWASPQILDKFREALTTNESLVALHLGNGAGQNIHPVTIQDLLDRNETLKRMNKFNPNFKAKHAVNATVASGKGSTLIHHSATAVAVKPKTKVGRAGDPEPTAIETKLAHHHKEESAISRFEAVVVQRPSKMGDPPASQAFSPY
uniref:Uncharacterized protein n=1 Tax=Entomoneis paludosa TaxID=265537 RepID=A0A7S2YPN5_9STRA|mmetsp:Transcript_452/g.1091  ORF Transcript_452/g.1091 Transcript_452/m.1091 type:complete len:509 (+) Transcript_452:3-1529(+)